LAFRPQLLCPKSTKLDRPVLRRRMDVGARVIAKTAVVLRDLSIVVHIAIWELRTTIVVIEMIVKRGIRHLASNNPNHCSHGAVCN
jgi:hypothetical protein